MCPQPDTLVAPAAYLAAERRAETKSEFFAGEVFALSGASRRHNLIVGNLVRELGVQLRGRPREVYASDMRVKVAASGAYAYPDVVVVCGEPEFEDEHVDTLLNPTLLVEVLSPSGERPRTQVAAVPAYPFPCGVRSGGAGPKTGGVVCPPARWPLDLCGGRGGRCLDAAVSRLPPCAGRRVRKGGLR